MRTSFSTYYIKSIFAFSVIVSLLSACGGDDHFLKDRDYRRQVEADFLAKKEIFSTDVFFNVVDKPNISQKEKEALMFLYAYMPIGDVTDYEGDFYLDNYRISVLAQKEMPWGNKVPDELFRHFVLPVRINNENLDNSREVFYHELKDRVANKTMKEAILEVNHWCHEKVVYKPSDSRTSSPLASVKTAYGRCGEESTFTVAALRSVGIPARQVYTPRWAHTDDNHAWVEAWADGTWYFLGACEPEPVLNLAWFNAPASRSMLMHTKVFGRYNGVEDVMKRTENYTEINVINNYGACEKGIVNVVDEAGKPVKDAVVEFKIYNYAEFFTISRRQTDENGQTHLTAGLGDLMVFACKDDKFNFQKLSFGKDKEITIKLERTIGENFTFDVDIVPPVERSNIPQCTSEEIELNKKRLAQEDSIRMAYESTMYDRKRANSYFGNYELDKEALWLYSKILELSRGNHETIIEFFNSVKPEDRNGVANLLYKLSEKDFRDVSIVVLQDMYSQYLDYKHIGSRQAIVISNHRISNEMLTPYYEFFKKTAMKEIGTGDVVTAEYLVDWIKKNINIRDEYNSQRIAISPKGVFMGRVADARSRDIFFVALARSYGINAWKDAVAGNILYEKQTDRGVEEYIVKFEEEKAEIIEDKTILKADYKALDWLSNPKYYSHFSISKYNGKQAFSLLNYEKSPYATLEDATWANTLGRGLKLQSGYYQLITGNRLANGGALVNVSFVNVEADKTTNTELVVRDDKSQVNVIGSLDTEMLFGAPDYGKYKESLGLCCCDLGYLEGFTEGKRSILNFNGRGYYLIVKVKPKHEPSNHVLRDIEKLSEDINQALGKNILLLFSSQEDIDAYLSEVAQGTAVWPTNAKIGIDIDDQIETSFRINMKMSDNIEKPLVIIGDTFNRVVFVSKGYTIGIGEKVVKVLKSL